MTLENEIELVLSYKKNVYIWRNDFNSVEYQSLDKLASKLGIEKLNRTRNCGCVDDAIKYLEGLFANKERIKLKIKTMESNFKLKGNPVIEVHGLGYALTNANITDELALQLLEKYPAHIVSFEKYPSNWKSLIGKKETIKPVNTEESNANIEVSKEIQHKSRGKKSKK